LKHSVQLFGQTLSHFNDCEVTFLSDKYVDIYVGGILPKGIYWFRAYPRLLHVLSL